jgi:hypothetical protein
MQILGISSAAWNTQILNPFLFNKPAKPTTQASQSSTTRMESSAQSDRSANSAQSTTILIASSSNSSQSADTQSTFTHMASTSGGITIVAEMSFTSSFSVTADGIHASTSFVEASSISTSYGTDLSYASASTSNLSASENSVNPSFSAMA